MEYTSRNHSEEDYSWWLVADRQMTQEELDREKNREKARLEMQRKQYEFLKKKFEGETK